MDMVQGNEVSKPWKPQDVRNVFTIIRRIFRPFRSFFSATITNRTTASTFSLHTWPEGTL